MVDRELESGEQIQWIDMPIPRFFTPTTIAVFLFAIPWTAITLCVMGATGLKMPFSGRDGTELLFFFFGVPFLLVGLAMFSTPVWAYRKALRTVYAITDRRAITITSGWSTTVRSYLPDKLKDVYRKDKRDGTGDVLITRRSWHDSDGHQQSEELGFLRIQNPKDVELMLKRLAEHAN